MFSWLSDIWIYPIQTSWKFSSRCLPKCAINSFCTAQLDYFYRPYKFRMRKRSNSFSLLVCPHPGGTYPGLGGMSTLARSKWGVPTLARSTWGPPTLAEGYPKVGTLPPAKVGTLRQGKYPPGQVRRGVPQGSYPQRPGQDREVYPKIGPPANLGTPRSR